jgi:hypothetical protein
MSDDHSHSPRDRRRIIANRLRNLAGHLDDESTLGGRIAADDCREAADLLDDLGAAYAARVTAERDLTPDDENIIRDLLCICAEVRVGGEPTGSKNWNPDCPVHPWDEQLQAQSDRAGEWQRRAAEARKRAR